VREACRIVRETCGDEAENHARKWPTFAQRIRQRLDGFQAIDYCPDARLFDLERRFPP
jgi:hypothetical protein